MLGFIFLLNKVIQPSGSPEAAVGTAEAVQQAGEAASQPSGGFFGNNSSMIMIIYILVMFAALYFFSIRPQRKKEREQGEMRSAIKIGDSVLLNSGLFGNIVDITEECFLIEFGTNKGIKIPVLKSEVAMVKAPNLTIMKEETNNSEESKN